jgi:hypothetical protein
MSRNSVLSILAWLAFATYVILFATEKLADHEFPFGDEWKFALVTITVLCMFGKSSKNPD